MACDRDRSSFGFRWAAFLLAICCAVPAWAGVQRWTAAGPPGAGVYDLAIDPVTPSTVYMVGYGVWKSTDAAATWARTTTGLESTNFRALVVNPADPSVLLAGSYDAGVFRSTDGGATWTSSSEGLPDVRVLALAFDPSAPSTVYVGLRYNGAHKSTDGGQTWSPINNGISEGVTITCLAVDPNNPQTIFAGTYDGALMTTDGGGSWSPLSGGFLDSPVASFAVDPTNSAVVYAGMEGRGVYKSTDGGATWNSSNEGLDHGVVDDMAIDPTTPAVIHLASEGGGMYKSIDAGATWMQAANGPRTPSVNAVALVPSSPDVVYAGTYGAGVHKSSDGGETWQPVNNGLHAANARSLAVDPAFGGRVWAATYGGVWRSDDSASSWTSHDGDLPIITAADLALDPDDSDTLYIATWRGLFKTENGGTSWTRIDTDPSPRSYEAIATHPVMSDRVYAGNWSGLWVSVDGGENWEQPATGPTDMRVISFAFDPTNPATMYAGGWDGIFRSDDDGDSWTSSLEDETIWSIAVDHSNPDTLYVCTYEGVFKSVDGGVTWSLSSDGLTAQYCWGVAVDPINPATVYQASGAGVFRSTNGAAEWSPFPGLEEYSVHDLRFSPGGGTLFAATNGGGVAAYTFEGSECSLDCSTIVPETAFAGSETYFQAEATAVGCSSPPSYEWDFGDGGAPSNEQRPSHAYGAAGTFPWTMTAAADDASCNATGTIVVWETPSNRYVPGAAHSPGAGGTVWRSDLAVVNPGPNSVTFDLTFIPYDGGPHVERSHTLAAGHAVEWNDVLVALFGVDVDSSTKGTIGIHSSSVLHVTARTYNQTSVGTFGQYLPALPAGFSGAPAPNKGTSIAWPGHVGVIPNLKKTAEFRSNLGVQNLGVTPVTVEVVLRDAAGEQLGNTRTRTVDVGRYWQMNDVFAALGAGSPNIAYATVEVTSADGLAWFYGSVVDNATGDPTTLPVLLPRAGDSEIAGIAHAPGAAGTTWRTDIAAVNLGATPLQLTPEFTVYNGGATNSAQATVPAFGTVEWVDVLVSLFGHDPAASVKGTLAFASMPDLCVTARTYNQAADGTFGQYLPAVTAAEGFGSESVAFIPQLRKSGAFRSNLGALNLSPFEVVAEIRLFDGGGTQIGNTRNQSVRANEYFQIDDVFGTLGAGHVDLAYATVHVLTPGGRVWAYGSVVDNATGDPTTIPALTP